jgi:hypothetical protein
LFVRPAFPQAASGPTAWDYVRDKRGGAVNKKDVASDFVAYDFGALCLLHQTWRLGYIGKEYQRLYVYFTSISKDSSDPHIYRVRGVSRVKNNVCDFTGTMRLSWVRRAHAPDACENDIRPAVQGISCFTYEFNEDPKQKHTGSFRGTAVLLWYLNKKKELCYDITWNCSDSFVNNCFVGTWMSYTTKVSRPCNWGDARIPFSDELDSGVGEFHPKANFLRFGWDTYENSDSTAWWK